MNKAKRSKLLFAPLGFSVLLASIGTSMANLAVPAISLDFGVSFSNARVVIVSYLLAITLFSLVMGSLGDIKGRPTILLAGTVLFVAGTLLSGYSYSFWILILARVIQGIGGAALISLPIAIVSEIVPGDKTGRAIGLLATMSAIGTASGPSIGGFLLGLYGWRSVFLLMTIFGLLNFSLLLNFIRLNRDSGSSPQRDSGISKTSKWTLEPVIRSHLVSNFIVSAVMMSTLVVGPFYLTYSLQLDPIQMGLIMSAGPITSALSGVFSGYAVDRFGSQSVLSFGLLQLLIGTISFVIAPAFLGTNGFVTSAVLLSLGYQLFLSANSSHIMKNADLDNKGFVSGALSLSRNLGLISGTIAMGGIFDYFSKPESSTSRTTSEGLQATFLVASILITILLFTNFKAEIRRNKWNRVL